MSAKLDPAAPSRTPAGPRMACSASGPSGSMVITIPNAQPRRFTRGAVGIATDREKQCLVPHAISWRDLVDLVDDNAGKLRHKLAPVRT